MSWWVAGGIVAYIAMTGYVGNLLLRDRYLVWLNQRAEMFVRWVERHPDSPEADEDLAQVLEGLEIEWRSRDADRVLGVSLFKALGWPVTWPLHHFRDRPQTQYLDILLIASARQDMHKREI
jgi:hypothetical protein